MRSPFDNGLKVSSWGMVLVHRCRCRITKGMTKGIPVILGLCRGMLGQNRIVGRGNNPIIQVGVVVRVAAVVSNHGAVGEGERGAATGSRRCTSLEGKKQWNGIAIASMKRIKNDRRGRFFGQPIARGRVDSSVRISNVTRTTC